MPDPTAPHLSHRRRLLAVGGAVAAGVGGLLLAPAMSGTTARIQPAGFSEDVSGPCDEAEHATDPECPGLGTTGADRDDDRNDDDGAGDGSTTSSTSTTVGVGASGPAPADEVRVVDAGEAGSVVVALEGGQLRLVEVRPAAGWQVEVEHATGPEIEVELTSGAMEVDVSVEIEDGRIRERVRIEDEATDAETRIEDGVVTRTEGDADDSSGHDADDADDDRSGHGNDHGDDDDDSSDDDSSGHGG